MPSLFQITNEIVQLETIVNLLDGSSEAGVPGGPGMVDEQLIRYLTEHEVDLSGTELEASLAVKIDGYVSYFRHLQARQKARKEEAKHISQLAAQDGRKIDQMKDAVKTAAEKLGRKKLEGNTRSITVSTSKRPAISWDDPSLLPPEFTEVSSRIMWTVDRKGLTEYIMDTGHLPNGVERRPIVSVRFR